MTFDVTEFQRYFFKVLGLIDFLEIYELYMQGQAPHATSAADCLGTFTNNPQFAPQLFDASLPLYLIWTHKLIKANKPKLLNFVSYFMPTDLIHMEVDPPFPTIFEGSTMDHKKHASIHNYSRTWLVYGDSFGDKENTLDCHVTGKPDVYGASTMTPMSELLRPWSPVQSLLSQYLTTTLSTFQSQATSSLCPSLSKGSRSLTTTSLSSQFQAASSSRHSLSKRSSRSKAWTCSKSIILLFFPNTYSVQQCQSHIHSKQDTQEFQEVTINFVTQIVLMCQASVGWFPHSSWYIARTPCWTKQNQCALQALCPSRPCTAHHTRWWQEDTGVPFDIVVHWQYIVCCDVHGLHVSLRERSIEDLNGESHLEQMLSKYSCALGGVGRSKW